MACNRLNGNLDNNNTNNNTQIFDSLWKHHTFATFSWRNFHVHYAQGRSRKAETFEKFLFYYFK